MSPSPRPVNPSADATAVVRALDAVSTQLGRIADALPTPVVEYAVTADDDATTPATTCSARYVSTAPMRWCIRAAHHGGRHTDSDGFHWPDAAADYPLTDGVVKQWTPADTDAACRVMETRTCPPSYNGPCGGDRPCARFESDDPAPWLLADSLPLKVSPPIPYPDELAEDERPARERQKADEEQALRWARRESLLVLLTRLQRGRALTEDEARTLREHVETEMRHVEQLAAGRATWKAKAEEMERDRDQRAAVLAEVLRSFRHETHPGRRCLQSDHVPVDEVERWRSVVHHDAERPWWTQVDEARAELAEAQAAIERVRAMVRQLHADAAAARADGHETPALSIEGSARRITYALDGTEQPTTETA